MSRFVFFLSFCLLSSVHLMQAGNRQYTIDGQLTGVRDSSKVFLIYQNNNELLTDSCFVINTKFSFRGTVGFPIPCRVMLSSSAMSPDIPGQNTLHFYLESGKIKIQGNETIANAIVSGTETNQLRLQFNTEVASIKEQAKAIQQEINQTPAYRLNDKVFQENINNRIVAITKEYNDKAFVFAKEHPQSIIGVYMLKAILEANPDNSEIESVFNSFSAKVRKSVPAVELRNMIQDNNRIQTGGTPPDFTLETDSGSQLALSDLKGKYVLMFFWNPDCGHCLQQLPYLKQSYEMYHNKGFTVLAIAILYPEEKQHWLDAIQREHLNWHNVSDFKSWNSKVNKLYKVHATPQTFLIDPAGKILEKSIYGDDLMTVLSRVFGHK